MAAPTRETCKQCVALFGAQTHEWRNADPARTDPGADGDETRGLPQRDGRACGAGEGAIAGRSVLGRDLLLSRQARRQSEADPGTARACACSPRGWRAANSAGRASRTA